MALSSGASSSAVLCCSYPLASDVSYHLTFISTLYFKNVPSGKILFIFSFTLLDKTYVTFVIGSQKTPFGAKIAIFGSSQNL